jgi:hypothetical protein
MNSPAKSYTKHTLNPISNNENFQKRNIKGKKKHITQCKEALGLKANHMGLT